MQAGIGGEPAACVSRPEYRSTSELRQANPKVPTSKKSIPV